MRADAAQDKAVEKALVATYDKVKSQKTLPPPIEPGDNEPLERKTLPALKDLNFKVSIWTILKDNIGKDISKISMPVVFSEPLSALQKTAFCIEYAELMETAAKQTDPILRMAYVTIYKMCLPTQAEKSIATPFKPQVGETFEFVTDKCRLVAE